MLKVAASCYSVYKGKSIIYTCIYVYIIVQYCNNFLLPDFDDYIRNFFYRLSTLADYSSCCIIIGFDIVHTVMGQHRL